MSRNVCSACLFAVRWADCILRGQFYRPVFDGGGGGVGVGLEYIGDRIRCNLTK